MNSFVSGEGVVGYLMMGVYFIAVALFLIMIISAIYHWNYYGVSRKLRFSLLTLFTFGGSVILLVTGIVMLRFI